MSVALKSHDADASFAPGAKENSHVPSSGRRSSPPNAESTAAATAAAKESLYDIVLYSLLDFTVSLTIIDYFDV